MVEHVKITWFRNVYQCFWTRLLRTSSGPSPTMKMVTINFPRNVGSCLHGGTFQNTIFLRNLLNGDQFSKSKNYTVTVRGGG